MKRHLTADNRDAINAELQRQIEAITKAKNPDEWARRLMDLFEVCDFATSCAVIEVRRRNVAGTFPDLRAAMRTIARALPVNGADSLHLAADMFQSLCAEHENAEDSRTAWQFVDSLKAPKPKKPAPAAPPKAEPKPAKRETPRIQSMARVCNATACTSFAAQQVQVAPSSNEPLANGPVQNLCHAHAMERIQAAEAAGWPWTAEELRPHAEGGANV